MFPVTITLHNAADLTAVMAALGATAVAFDESTALKPKAEAPGKPSAARTAPSPRTAEAAPSQPAPSAAAPAPSPEATSPAAAATSASQPADAAPFEYTTLQKAVNERVAKFGKDALLAIATKHGAASFRTLPAEKWAAAHADVVALG